MDFKNIKLSLKSEALISLENSLLSRLKGNNSIGISKYFLTVDTLSVLKLIV